MNPEKTIVNELLPSIRQEFYTDDKLFYYDRKMLMYALTYPASWLHRHNLKMTIEQYNHLLKQIINDIRIHGDPKQYNKYLPRYLLKCIQNHLKHNSDKIYLELRSINNTISQLTCLIAKIDPQPDYTYIDVLQRTHAILKPNCTRRHKKGTQLSLF